MSSTAMKLFTVLVQDYYKL